MKKVLSIVSVCLFLSFFLPLASGAWWNNSWFERQEVNLTVASGSTPQNYQVLLNVTHNGNMQNDFDDLRFVDNDGSILLGAWLEDKSDSEWATVWVKVNDSIGTSNTTIYLYYANSVATAYWNGTETCDWYSGFETGDTSEWTFVGSDCSVVTDVVYKGNYALTCPGGGSNRTGYYTQNMTEPFKEIGVVRVDAHGGGYNPAGFPMMQGGYEVALEWGYFRYYQGSYTNWPSNNTYVLDTWYRVKQTYNFTSHKQQAWRDGDYMGEIGLKNSGGVDLDNFTRAPSFCGSASLLAPNVWFDDYCILKYHSPEPTAAFGSKEVSPFDGCRLFINNASSYTNDTTPTIDYTPTCHDLPTYCRLLINGTAYGDNSTSIANASSNYITANDSLADRDFSVTVNCTNGTLMNASSAYILTVDTVAPSVSITYPTNMTYGPGTSIVLNFTYTENHTSTCFYKEDGAFGFPLPIGYTNGTSLAVSAACHHVELWCSDSATNIGTDDVWYTLNNSAPSTPTNLFPANGSSDSDSTPTVSWDNSTDFNGDNLTYYVHVDDDSDFSSLNQTYSGAANSTTLSTLSEGTWWWKVLAGDGTDNSSWVTYNFTVIAPGIVGCSIFVNDYNISSGVVGGDAFTSKNGSVGNALVVNYITTCYGADNYVCYFSNGTNYVGQNATALSNGSFNYISTNVTWYDGNYSVSVNCSDGSHSNSSSITNLVIDATPPSISITLPANISYASPQTLNFTYTENYVTTCWYREDGGFNTSIGYTNGTYLAAPNTDWMHTLNVTYNANWGDGSKDDDLTTSSDLETDLWPALSATANYTLQNYDSGNINWTIHTVALGAPLKCTELIPSDGLIDNQVRINITRVIPGAPASPYFTFKYWNSTDWHEIEDLSYCFNEHVDIGLNESRIEYTAFSAACYHIELWCFDSLENVGKDEVWYTILGTSVNGGGGGGGGTSPDDDENDIEEPDNDTEEPDEEEETDIPPNFIYEKFVDLTKDFDGFDFTNKLEDEEILAFFEENKTFTLLLLGGLIVLLIWLFMLSTFLQPKKVARVL